MTRLLEIRDLSVSHPGAPRPELERLSLQLDAGEILVLLGEAGSGKDALLRVLGGVPQHGDVISGTLQFGSAQPERASLRSHIRTAWLAGIESRPLSPHASALAQLTRVIARKLGAPLASATAELEIALGRLDGAPAPGALDKPPGQLRPETLAWGLLATALAQAPELLLADHAFAGLPPVHARALTRALIAEQKRLGFAILCATASTEITNQLGGRLMVLRQGRVVEEGSIARLATAQAHAYTQMLFKGAPASNDPSPLRNASRGEPVLQVYGIDIPHSAGNRAHDNLTFELRRGASLALIGEDGSGRRELSRALIGLDRVSAGRVVLDAVDIGILSQNMMARLRRRVAFITGDDDMLDPRMTIWDTVAEPLRAHLSLPRNILSEYGEAALKRVGLASLKSSRSVATLSTFDRRRLQVARAIVTAPLLAVVDEPLRGLDAFAQSVMLDLLRNFRAQEGPALLVITADFAVAQVLAETAMIFRNGAIVERGLLREIVLAPKDSYTKALIEAKAGPGLSPAAAQV